MQLLQNPMAAGALSDWDARCEAADRYERAVESNLNELLDSPPDVEDAICQRADVIEVALRRIGKRPTEAQLLQFWTDVHVAIRSELISVAEAAAEREVRDDA